MKARLSALGVLITLFLYVLVPAAGSASAIVTSAPAAPGAPLLFVENAGQFDPRARFEARLGNATLWLTDDALWITVMGPSPEYGSPESEVQSPASDLIKVRVDSRTPRQAPRSSNSALRPKAVNLKLSFEGANPHPVVEPEGRLSTHVSYFRGNDPARWQPEVPTWSSVRYHDLYPGIDLVVSGTPDGWRPVMESRPGADLQAVRLRIEGAEGAALEDGAVCLQTAAGEFWLPLIEMRGAADITHATLDGGTVLSPFAARGATPYVSSRAPLSGTQDLVYSTFLGGGDSDYDPALVIDNAGASYVTGFTRSPDFPTTPGAYDRTCSPSGPYNPCNDAFIAKLSSNGSRLIYATFLGGEAGERGYSIAVDPSGAAYVAGYSYSSDFPTTPGAYNRTLHAGGSVFVSKLNAAGSALVYSTFLGPGCPNDYGNRCGLALDGMGNAYVVGMTGGTDYPTTPGAFQTVCHACDEHYEGFVTKLNADGSALVYSTWLGGSLDDWATRVVVDPSGAAYVTGYTMSPDFPTTSGAFDTGYNGNMDAFVTKVAPDGSALVYSTYLGGTYSECPGDCAIAIDAAGAAYVTGPTQSSDFPTTPGAFDRTFHGGNYWYTDVFLSKLAPDGSALVFSTFLGGACDDGSKGVQVDPAGRVYVAGYTCSPDFPTTPDAYDRSVNSRNAAFLALLDTSGSVLEYSTLLEGFDPIGGSAADGLALDAAGAAYLVGVTDSADFPTTPGAFDRIQNGDLDLFVVKLTPHMELRAQLPVVLGGR